MKIIIIAQLRQLLLINLFNIKQNMKSIRKNFILSLCQMKVTTNKEENLRKAEEIVINAAINYKSNIVVLPEYFNSPQGMTTTFAEVETESKSLNLLKMLAKKLGIYLIGGSMPEKDGDKYYNTCYCIDRSGEIAAKYRKIHLFDIDIPNKLTYKESTTLSAGNKIKLFETEYCKFGIGICYDMRFPELSQSLKNKGAEFLIFPSAFTAYTGSLHWELLQRTRAVDNNCFVATCSPSRNIENPKSFQVFGESMIIDPFGNVISKLGYEEGILQSNINLERIADIENQIPTLKQKRWDVYNLN